MSSRSQKNRNVNGRKANIAGRWKLYAVMSAVTLVIVAGFFFSGQQHISSWDYSIRNSRLRTQISDLETEKRRLVLAREVALSPTELKKLMSVTTTSRAELAVSKVPKTIPTTARTIEKVDIKAVEPKPGYSIVKTAMTMAVTRPVKQQKNSARDQAE